ncbi:hypothetical protein [Parasphaerochaeta coccoides]|uniref:Uncharacterized protein n=1 Tax=Parasphaerochaeta coccoides (strain ATCC BAA-1237 / DSM 17374 / SPN1) TaxID=760011 RepID=F4GHD3_PARC1|nr:hypothetical protein [Parasphaerochaeta coccoides]AEC02032.1 hypothetical protein Spico_0807 [Parasphaerochaeta coccoides DSM 17374]
MKINLTRRRTWSPDFLGNEQKPEAEQIKVEFTKPNANQRETMQRVINARTPEGRLAAYTETDIALVMRECGVRISGLTVVEDGKEVLVTTGEELCRLPDDYCMLLAKKIALKILELDLDEAVLKNLLSASTAV